MLATPVWAQMVTAPGLIGPNACLRQNEMSDLDLLDITAVTNRSVTLQFRSFTNLYSELGSRTGDGGQTSFSIEYEVHNARTGAHLVCSGIRTITSTRSNYGVNTEVRRGLLANTPYWATVRVIPKPISCDAAS